MNVKTLLSRCETLINNAVPNEPPPIVLKIKKSEKDKLNVPGMRIIKETKCCCLIEFNTVKLYRQLTGVN